MIREADTDGDGQIDYDGKCGSCVCLEIAPGAYRISVFVHTEFVKVCGLPSLFGTILFFFFF